MSYSLQDRPLLVTIAGPNGAGKSSFYRAFLARHGLPWVNADEIAKANQLRAYSAARVAVEQRRYLLKTRKSFVFETVFSDPVGDKANFLLKARDQGYTVLLIYIGLDRPETSDMRVAMRVTKGGHDVPQDKIQARYPRSLANLRRAVGMLPWVRVYDNSDLARPYEKLAEFRDGRAVERVNPWPAWLAKALAGL